MQAKPSSYLSDSISRKEWGGGYGCARHTLILTERERAREKERKKESEREREVERER